MTAVGAMPGRHTVSGPGVLPGTGSVLLTMGDGLMPGDYPAHSPAGVHQLVEAQALRAPEAEAVRFGDDSLSYGEVDHRANQLARHLVELGMRPGGLAAVALGRGPDVVVAMLAVLKTGAAFVPLEPRAPDPVLRHVLGETPPTATI
jgi:non-ribosomal peptide synthetase component F